MGVLRELSGAAHRKEQYEKQCIRVAIRYNEDKISHEQGVVQNAELISGGASGFSIGSSVVVHQAG